MSQDFTPSDSAPSTAPAILTTLVRQVLLASGAWAVGKGYITGEEAIQWGGAAVGVSAALWGLYSRFRRTRQLQDAIAAPAGKAK